MVELFLHDKISLVEIVKWANITSDKMFDSDENEILINRLVNDILIDLKEMEDDVEDLYNLNENDVAYIKDVFNKFLSQLKGEVNYTETYKVMLSADDFKDELKVLINEAFKSLSNEQVLSLATSELIKSNIERSNCLTKADILILEIMNSMLLVNECYKSMKKDVLIGTLGKSVDSHKLNDEMRYLESLYMAFEGKCGFRFSLTLNATNILYTNIRCLDSSCK